MKSYFFLDIISRLKYTPFHPQWFVHRQQTKTLNYIKSSLTNTVLDIGCADQYLENYLVQNSYYIGLDYLKTTDEMYHTTPTIYGDAQNLPINDSSVDSVALLDVLEHLNKPENCIKEIYRVMKTSGVLCLQVPFIYPIHDAPYDYHRWTLFGLTNLLKSNSFKIETTHSQGNISETFSLLTNIGLAKITLDLIKISKIFGIVVPIISILVFITNLIGFLLGKVCKNNTFMPFGYLLICTKK